MEDAKNIKGKHRSVDGTEPGSLDVNESKKPIHPCRPR